MIIRIIYHKIRVPLSSSRSLETISVKILHSCRHTWDRSLPSWYRSQAICDRSQDRSQPLVHYSISTMVPIASTWDQSQPTGIGRKIGLSTRRPWDHLLVSVSAGLVSVVVTGDRSQVQSHSQRDLEPIFGSDPTKSGIGRNAEIGSKATGLGTRAENWSKLMEKPELSYKIM